MTVHLPGSSVATSQVGLGSAPLSAGWGRPHSIRLVHAACAAGIRHFDTAPPYGMGTAEEVLGQALEQRRHQVTIATKVGLARPRHAALVITARNLAAPLRRIAPKLTRRAGASAYHGLRSRPPLTPKFIRESLCTSLRLLRTDYVDLLLLHEAAPDDLTDVVLRTIDDLRKEGKALSLGTGTSFASTLAIRAQHPQFFDVYQYSWSLLEARPEEPAAFTVTHGSIHNALARVREWLREKPERLRGLSDATGIDLSNDDELGYALLGAALAHNPEGITLVSSRQQNRVEGSARLLRERSMVDAGVRLMTALCGQPEGMAL